MNFINTKILIKNKSTVLIFVMAVFSFLFLVTILNSGCSPQERSGVSRLPQNRPASWETGGYAF